MEAIITDAKNTQYTVSREEAESCIRKLLLYVGENPDREGLVGTPDRIIRMWKEIFRGYNPAQKPKITTFENEDKITDMVLYSV